MTQTPDHTASVSPLDKPLTMSRRTAALCLAAAVLLAAGLVTKQICFARIATRDATGFYLPLAERIAAGDTTGGQSPMIPPLYPTTVAYMHKALSAFADCPIELSARFTSAVCLLLLVVCVFCIARELGGLRSAVLAAALAAGNQWLVRFGAAVGPEMMYSLFVALVVLMLMYYWRRPSVMFAIAAGSAAALAALTRPEGIYVPFVAIVTIIAVSLRHAGRRTVRTIVHVLLVLVVVFALWMPRLVYMKQQTGYCVLDVRQLHRVPGLTVKSQSAWYAQPNEIILPPSDLTRLGEAEYSRSMTKDIREQIDEAQETLLWVVGIQTWLFLLAALVFCRRGAKPRTRNLLIGAVIVLQLAIASTVKMDRRYVVMVSTLMQVWAGLGAIEFVDWLRRKYGRRLGGLMLLRIPAMMAILAGMACLSLFGSNQGSRHAELKRLGDMLLAARGEGLIIVSDTPEVPYYARGRMLQIRAMTIDGFELEQSDLQHLVDAADADVIVVRQGAAWCRWIYESASANKLPVDVLIASAEREGKFVYAVDARRLFSQPSQP